MSSYLPSANLLKSANYQAAALLIYKTHYYFKMSLHVKTSYNGEHWLWHLISLSSSLGKTPIDWTDSLLFSSVYYLHCNSAQKLEPLSRSRQQRGVQTQRHSLPCRAYTLESCPTFRTNTFLFHTRKNPHEMKHNHKRLKVVKKNFQISDQGLNSKLLEYFKSALYVIPQVIKFLPLLKCWIPD